MWVALLIAGALVLSVSQTILYALGTPSGAVYPLVHNFVEDYYQYLDIMRQGFDGWWLATSRLTPEVYPRMVASVFLLFLGHAARALHVSLPMAYTGARVLGGIVLMTLVYQLSKRTFPQSLPKQLIAMAFVLFATSVWGWGPDGPTVAPLTHAWTELDPIFRWSFVPHHLWSKVGMVAAFLFLLKRQTPYLILLTILMGFTNPVVYTTFVPTLLLFTLLSFARHSLAKLDWRVFVAIGVSIVVALYHRYLQTHIFPWTSYLLWEQTLGYRVSPFDYAVSLGPTLVLFVLATPALLRLGRIGNLYVAWATSSWVMLYLAAPFVPVTPERFLGGYQFIPMGIGAALWVFSLKRSHLLRLGVVIFLFLYFAIGLRASFDEHLGYVAANRNNPQVYLSQELTDALTYLSQNGKPEDVVMAPYEISTMIPGLTGKRVLAGHTMFTYDVGKKRSAISDFFTARDTQVARDYRVRWVLAPASWIPPQDIGLVKRYNNKSYGIYAWY